MYRNEVKDVRKLSKRCTSFINIKLMVIKTAADEYKKES